MLPKNKIDDLIEKHSLLEKQLSSGDIDKKKFAEKSKEYSDLNEFIDHFLDECQKNNIIIPKQNQKIIFKELDKY